MIGLVIYCAGLVVVIIGASMICEWIENANDNNWRHRVTATDIEKLAQMFEDDYFVAKSESGEEFIVGYTKGANNG